MPRPDGAFTQRINQEGDYPTYTISIADYTPPSAATDMLCIVASPTKTIRITYMDFAADATGGSTGDFYCYKRTTANSGGTASHPTPAQHDSQDPAPTAVINLYSVNAVSLGSGVLIRAGHNAVPAAATAIGGGLPAQHSFGCRGAAKTIVLRAGTNEQFCISNNGDAVPAGMSCYMNVEWTEE